MRTVADRYRLTAYHKKHCWRPSGSTNSDDLKQPWNSK